MRDNDSINVTAYELVLGAKIIVDPDVIETLGSVW